MGRYLVRRALFGVLVLVIISFLTFFIFIKFPPGDPARRLAGKNASKETIELVRHQIGLDQPFFSQYVRFAQGMVPWGSMFLNEEVYYSWINKQTVKDEIAERLPYSVVLALGGAILWLLIGIPIGIVSAVRRRSAADRAGMLFALFGISMPTFLLGIMLIFIFSYKLAWAPPTGIEIGDDVWASVAKGKFVLPWITIAITSAAFYTRVVRGNMLEVLSEDYIRTARAKGLSERRVTYKHAMRASLTPVVTMLGLDLAALLAGAVITESVFAIPGVGLYAIQSLGAEDFPPVMAVTMLAALFVVVANLVVDVLYANLDPRVRYT